MRLAAIASPSSSARSSGAHRLRPGHARARRADARSPRRPSTPTPTPTPEAASRIVRHLREPAQHRRSRSSRRRHRRSAGPRLLRREARRRGQPVLGVLRRRRRPLPRRRRCEAYELYGWAPFDDAQLGADPRIAISREGWTEEVIDEGFLMRSPFPEPLPVCYYRPGRVRCVRRRTTTCSTRSSRTRRRPERTSPLRRVAPLPFEATLELRAEWRAARARRRGVRSAARPSAARLASPTPAA